MLPAWPAPNRVQALFTTRQGGVSTGRWADAGGAGGLNLGSRSGDDPQRVAVNRRRLSEQVGRPIRWLDQVHGNRVVEVGAAGSDGATLCNDAGDARDADAIDDADGAIETVDTCEARGARVARETTADAQVTTKAGVALGVLVADCLPVLLADRAGSIVGAAHAGWRGLSAGVLENTVALMRLRRPQADLIAWLGPCIGPSAFEVGEDVLGAFVLQDPGAERNFQPGLRPGKWWADLSGLAARRLDRLGITSITRAGMCTAADPGSFWSYRRDGACGRMAGVIWLRE